MEFSPYLQALQSIQGRTPGEKYCTLSRIAKTISRTIGVNEPIQIFPSDELPNELIPWVKIEVADILKRLDGVAEALRSEDLKVFNRALKIKWYFIGNVPNYSDVNFFVNQLFPYICLRNRCKIIRALGQYLRPYPNLAEEFYDSIAAQYGYDSARPLLIACKEHFVWETMVEHRLIFNLDEIKYIYYKFPTVALDYLKKSLREVSVGRQLHEIYIDKYRDFLPLLLKKHSREFVEFIERSSNMGIQLNSKKTKLFLKVEIDAVINNPALFLPMLNVKYVLKKLKLSHFRLILKKLIRNDMETMDFEEIKYYLNYIPAEYRTFLITVICIEKYGYDWVDDYELISPTALRTLSIDDRIKLVTKKLELDPNWYVGNGENIEHSWRCYLPTKDSIPAIRAEIGRCESVSAKLILMRQLILTCDINNDSRNLRSTLYYISTEYTYSTIEYTKEEEWELVDILLSAITQNRSLLELDHWNTIYDHIQFLKRRHGTISNELNVKIVLIEGIKFDLINNQPIKKKIDLLTEIYRDKPWLLDWNILQNTPTHEKLCLQEFSKSILKIFIKHHKENTYQWRETCVTFLKAIYDYNYRHYRKTKNSEEKLSIKKFPWLLESVRKLINQRNRGINMRNYQAIDLVELDDLIRCNEPDVLPPESIEAYTKTIKFFQWTKLQYMFNPQPAFCNYEKYYEECRDKIRRRCIRKFVRFCRWHQDIPIKLIELALKDLRNEDRNYEAIIVLSILVEGPVFERFITPFIPDPERITSDLLLKATVEGIKYVNPIVSIDLIRQICNIGIDDIIKKCLFILTAYMGPNRVIPFCRELCHRNVNIFKNIMDAMRIVANFDEILPILKDYWEESKQGFDEDDIDDKNKRHQLIRSMLIVFETKACSRIWDLVDQWLNELDVKDEPRTLAVLSMFEDVPCNWLGEYLEKVIVTIRRLEEESGKDGHWAQWYETAPLFDDFPLEAALLLPDHIHQFLISVYWNIAHTNRKVLAMAIRFSINSYILPVDGCDLEERLDFFSQFFALSLLAHWNVRESSDELRNGTVQHFLRDFIKILIFKTDYSSTKNRLVETTLNSFLIIFTPQHDVEFYCYLYFYHFYDDKTSAVTFIDRIYNILSLLFECFSIVYIDSIALYLYRVMKLLYKDQVTSMIVRLLQKFDTVANYLAACLFPYERSEMDSTERGQIFTYLQCSRDAFILSRIQRRVEVISEEE